MFFGVVIFIAALLLGLWRKEVRQRDLPFLTRSGLSWLFGALSLVVLGALLFASDHFVEEHLWEHIVRNIFPEHLRLDFRGAPGHRIPVQFHRHLPRESATTPR